MSQPQQNYTSPTGAVRASAHSESVRYDLLLSNEVAMRRLAETFAEGFKKYGPVNWKKGFPVSELFAHFFDHIIKWISGDKTEDHLAHACWNLMAIMWQEEHKPELQDFPFIIATLQTSPDAPGKQAAAEAANLFRANMPSGTKITIPKGFATCAECGAPAITHEYGNFLCDRHRTKSMEEINQIFPRVKIETGTEVIDPGQMQIGDLCFPKGWLERKNWTANEVARAIGFEDVIHKIDTRIREMRLNVVEEEEIPKYPKGACPLFVGTSTEGKEWHETATYKGVGGRCVCCASPLNLHYGYLPLDK